MNFKILTVIITFSTLLFSSCRFGTFTGDQPVSSQPAAPPQPLVVDGVRTSYADVVAKTSPAVVRIEADHRATPQSKTQFPGGGDDFFRQFQNPQQNRRPRVERGVGSGVVVDANGTLITNNHVVEDAEEIRVRMSDNKEYVAKVVGTDKPSDLAVLKIEATDLPYLNLGNSDQVRVGDMVLAIGNPLGIGQTVTAGIISAKGRQTGLGDGSFEDFLQTDAPINKGNSGGALVNLNGELIGINSQILSPGGSLGGNIGIAFAIPSNMAKSVMDQLVKDGRVRRGQLGVGIQPITNKLAEALQLPDTSGIIVSEVKAGSAADKAGIKRDDVILSVNGEKVDDTNGLRNKVAATAPGTQVTLTIRRDGKQSDITVTLDELKESDAERNAQGQNNGGEAPNAQNQSGKLGLSLQPLTPQTARQAGIEAGTQGMVVTDVDPSGPAAEEGLDRGDVILEINRKPVSSLEDVQSALSTSGDRPVLLLIARQGRTIYLTVRPR